MRLCGVGREVRKEVGRSFFQGKKNIGTNGKSAREVDEKGAPRKGKNKMGREPRDKG